MASIDVFSNCPAAVLELTGEDHLDFLQSQGTADLRGPSGLFRYSLWLDHKGRVHGDSFVLKINDEKVILVSYETSAKVLIEKFQKHIVADDVEIEDHTSRWRLLSLPRASIDGLLADRARHLEPERFFIEADGYVFSGRRLGLDSVDYLVPEDTTLPLELNELSFETAESMRIAAGIPAIPRDSEPGILNPVECALISGISFDKGCYLGQEVVARVHRLQRLSKRLVRLAPAAAANALPPTVAGDVILDGAVVGAFTSIARDRETWQAIGWLKAKVSDGEHDFECGRLRVQTLPDS
jgi:folate-binding protein YgfZ